MASRSTSSGDTRDVDSPEVLGGTLKHPPAISVSGDGLDAGGELEVDRIPGDPRSLMQWFMSAVCSCVYPSVLATVFADVGTNRFWDELPVIWLNHVDGDNHELEDPVVSDGQHVQAQYGVSEAIIVDLGGAGGVLGGLSLLEYKGIVFSVCPAIDEYVEI